MSRIKQNEKTAASQADNAGPGSVVVDQHAAANAPANPSDGELIFWYKNHRGEEGSGAMNQLNPNAIRNLKQFQRQIDAEGVEVGVSREALDQVLAHAESASERISELLRFNNEFEGQARAARAALRSLVEAAEAFRIAMIESGATAKVRQDLYFDQLRSLESKIVNANAVLFKVHTAADSSEAGRGEPQSLREAAQAVIDRWDTPLWKDAPATAQSINRLRAALSAPVGEPDPDLGKRIASLAADLVTAGWMASRHSIDRVVKDAERKLLEFACDETRRYLDTHPPAPAVGAEEVARLHRCTWRLHGGLSLDDFTKLRDALLSGQGGGK